MLNLHFQEPNNKKDTVIDVIESFYQNNPNILKIKTNLDKKARYQSLGLYPRTSLFILKKVVVNIIPLEYPYIFRKEILSRILSAVCNRQFQKFEK